MKPARGFTLVEILLVVTLTLLLAGVAIGGLTGIKTWRAAAAIQRVRDELLYARNQALLTGRRTLWTLDFQNQTYEIRQESAPHKGALNPQTLDHPLTGVAWIVKLKDLAAELGISAVEGANQGKIGFDADGVPIGTDGAALPRDVEVKFNQPARITVYSGSGLCEIQRP